MHIKGFSEVFYRRRPPRVSFSQNKVISETNGCGDEGLKKKKKKIDEGLVQEFYAAPTDRYFKKTAAPRKDVIKRSH